MSAGAPVGVALIFDAFYTASGVGATGLTVTVDVYRGASEIVTAGSATEIGDGVYRYTLVSGSVNAAGAYVAVFKTAGPADQQHIAARGTVGLVDVGYVEGGDASDALGVAQTGDSFARIGVTGAGLTSLATAAGLASLVATVGGIVTTLLTLVADIWAYANRTLTQSGASVTTAVTGTAITAYIGAYNSITLTGLTDFTGWKRIYFTVKTNPREHADSEAVLQVAKSSPASGASDGLLYVQGVAGTKAHGSLTVNSTTSITIVVKNAASSQWAAGGAFYDVWYIGSDDEPRPASQGGKFLVVPAVTRAAS